MGHTFIILSLQLRTLSFKDLKQPSVGAHSRNPST